MAWTVCIHRKVAKKLKKLRNDNVIAVLRLLVSELEKSGPAPSKGWHHYGKLKTTSKVDRRHCHLTKGQPTYVCCWEVKDKKIRIIEVYYVGTHEKAPY